MGLPIVRLVYAEEKGETEVIDAGALAKWSTPLRAGDREAEGKSPMGDESTHNLYTLPSAGHVRPTVAEARNPRQPTGAKIAVVPHDDGVSQQREERCRR